MIKEYKLFPLFDDFIKDTLRKKRLKPNGEYIKVQTVENYKRVKILLMEFCKKYQLELRIRAASKYSQRELKVERAYWNKFYRNFSNFLFKDHKCYDNYVGSVFKTIKTFFRYLNSDRFIPCGDFYTKFYVRKEEISIITLLPHQLQFLIQDKEFETSLPKNLRDTKDLFVFGCTVALRYSDLLNLRKSDIENVNGNCYLSITTQKTGAPVKIKLPDYAKALLYKKRYRKPGRGKFFYPLSGSRLNINIRRLIELAGWVQPIDKSRKQAGIAKEIRNVRRSEGGGFRFCDMVSTHTMRRTAITTMLILGMPELVVRKISGHTSSGKSFYRYVNFAQAYMDIEMDKVYRQLISNTLMSTTKSIGTLSV